MHARVHLTAVFHPFHLHTMNASLLSRITKELAMLSSDPPPGVWAGLRGERLTEIDAQIQVRSLQPLQCGAQQLRRGLARVVHKSAAQR